MVEKTILKLAVLICIMVLFSSCASHDKSHYREVITVALDYVETQQNKDYEGYLKLFHPESKGYSFYHTVKKSILEDIPEIKLNCIRIIEIGEEKAILELELFLNWEKVKTKRINCSNELSICTLYLSRLNNKCYKIIGVEWRSVEASE